MLRVFRHYISLRLIGVITIDTAILVGSIYIALLLRLQGYPSYHDSIPYIFPKAVIFALICQFVLYLVEMYDIEKEFIYYNAIIKILISLVSALLLLGVVYYIIPSLQIGMGIIIIAFISSYILLVLWRTFFNKAFRFGRLNENVLIMGTGKSADVVIELLSNGYNPGYHLVGLVDDSNKNGKGSKEVNGIKILGESKDLFSIAMKTVVKKIIVSVDDRRGSLPMGEALECKLRGIDVVDMPTFYEQLTGKIFIKDLRPSWLIFSDGFKNNAFTKALKRGMDIIFSFVGLIILSPLMLLIAIMIKIDSKGSVLFKQKRVGESNKEFVLLKFRSMIYNAENKSRPVWASKDDSRVTRIGRYLRNARMDEIPQLINVLKGEMSFVGPRPEHKFFVSDFQETIPFYIQRHTVKPGITGWAQVKYSYGSSVEDTIEKLQYDLYYIKNISIFLDGLIFLQTVRVVLFGRGAR